MSDSNNFEQLLKKNSARKTSALYNSSIIRNRPTIKPQDVLDNVYSQIKTIQLADARSSRVGKDLNGVKKSNFLPVTKLPVYTEIPKPKNTFETQCVFDTQLIDIIDNAEALINTHKGMTQEFDTTFTHKDDRNNSHTSLHDKTNKENRLDVIEFETTLSQTNVDKTVMADRKERDGNTQIEETDITQLDHQVELVRDVFLSNTQIEETDNTQLDHQVELVRDVFLKDMGSLREICDKDLKENKALASEKDIKGHISILNNIPIGSEDINIDNNIIEKPNNTIDIGDVIDSDDIEEERPPSPVLVIKAKRNKKKTPLVVSLEVFEKFERLALPLLDSNDGFDTYKHLIDSQILKGELYLNTNENILFNDNCVSPTIENSSEMFQHTEELVTDVANLDNIKERDKSSDSLKDEILFSSDEENDYVHREIQDIPLTAALETSFYDRSDVLEKTMYVGFQTASNKSIQINTNSFQKAQFMFDEGDNIDSEDFNLTELVEICDDKKYNNVSSIDSLSIKVQGNANFIIKANQAKPVVNKDNMTQVKFNEKEPDEEMIVDTKIKEPTVTDYNNKIKKPPEETNFVRFKTASNKTIDLSEKVLNLGKKVFTDIDFDKKIDLGDQDLKPIEETKVEVSKDNKKHLDDNELEMEIDDKIDDLILQEFENIEMSLEEKEISCQSSFQGKTASNKLIVVSDKAKAKTKDVFQDIDLGEINEKSEESNLLNNTILDSKLQNEMKRFQPEAKTFIGFKTANNKNIKVSAQALVKTKNIFQDIDTEIDNPEDTITPKQYKIKPLDYLNQPSTSKAAFVGFKTANNKNIIISEAAMSKSTKIFKDIDQESPKLNHNDEKKRTGTFNGFKTGNNKDISLSEQAIVKSRKIVKDMDENKDFKLTEGLSTEGLTKTCKGNPSFSGFRTANNKAVIITEESLAKSKKIFEETIPTDTVLSPSDIQPKNTKLKDQNNTFIGFQTASKKPVSVSAIALEKSKKIFQDIESVNKINTDSENKFKFAAINTDMAADKDDFDNNQEHLDKYETAKSKSSFVGFKTASNKNVNISREALAKTMEIFENLDVIQNTNISKEPKRSFGLPNVGNKYVGASKAIEKIKDIFDDIEVSEVKEPLTFMGFPTANKKKVKISKEALEKTKDLFKDIEIPETIDQGTFKGFQTASNKTVEVSKEAIEKTKTLFSDIELPEIQEQVTFKGFQTASSKKVVISKEALEKTKALFNDIDNLKVQDPESNLGFNKVTTDDDGYKETHNSEEKHIKSIFSFQTANNKNINISKDALKMSRKLLNDTENKLMNTEKDEKIETVNIENIINTQVLHNFEETLYTEDFIETPRKNKRSSSPILFCPRAKKRRKFETPYKDINLIKEDIIKTTKQKSTNTVNIKFTDNYKKNRIYTLKDLTKFVDNKIKSVDPYISNFNLDNILNFEFENQRNDLTDAKINIQELKKIFLNNVNKNLVPEGWIDNHLKLIIWKLLSYEIKFPKLGFVCTMQNVMDQLKYRYDKELFNAERSALRKIFERDDVSTKTMILCVAGVYVDGVSVSSVTTTENLELLLTDGWYCIKATIDKMLSKLVYDGRIVVGCKIVTSGAELVNCEQGIAPWEDTSSICLKLFGNSTRLAHWDAKLGYTRAAILSQLSSVRVDGGKVVRLRVFVSRVYPLLYVEKFADGSTVTRSERLEHLHQMKYENERELMVERIYEEVQKEFSDQESQDLDTQSSAKRKSQESGSQIAKMMKRSKDPMEFRGQLTTSQVQLLENHTSKYRDKVLEAIQKRIQDKVINRNVITLARGRIAAVNNTEITKGMLSIWKPNDAVLELFKEGAWIDVMNVVPTAMRYSEIQITAGRQSVFKSTKRIYELPPLLQSIKRRCYPISDVAQNPSMTTDYNEIDTVGIVFQIEPNNREFESNKNFQNVYLADADKNIICLNFWGGLKKFGYENILDTGQIIACANLQKRAGNTRKNIPQFRVTEFSYFTKTSKNVVAREIVDDLNKKLLGLDRRKFCDDCVAIKNNYTAIRCLNNFENESPYRFNKSDYSFSRNKMFIDTPLGVKPNKNEDANLNLTGLDFESTFKQETQELSPKTLLRKNKVNEKIAKLKSYGEPPPLSPINIINKSINAKNSYKSPLVSNNSSITTPNIRNVAISNKLPENSPISGLQSPVICTKKGYIRSVPVKLNFADANKDNDDHFAEDFDGSPPLSLD